jgi:hypothetical protein
MEPKVVLCMRQVAMPRLVYALMPEVKAWQEQEKQAWRHQQYPKGKPFDTRLGCY